MKRLLSVLLAVCMMIGVCGMVGANAGWYPWAEGDLKEFTAWTVCSPLVVYEHLKWTYNDGSSFPYIGISKEMNENFLLLDFQQKNYPFDANGEAWLSSSVSISAGWENIPYYIQCVAALATEAFRTDLTAAIGLDIKDKALVMNLFDNGNLQAAVARAHANVQSVLAVYFKPALIIDINNYVTAFEQAMEVCHQAYYAGICSAFIKNINDLTAEINALFALADEHLCTLSSSDASTFAVRTLKCQEIKTKAQDILDKIEWIDIDWTPAMVADLKAYYAENFEAIKEILEELGFDTSVFTNTPPPQPTTPEKWWQKAPDWVQWILRYLLFGWIWMR